MGGGPAATTFRKHNFCKVSHNNLSCVDSCASVHINIRHACMCTPLKRASVEQLTLCKINTDKIVPTTIKSVHVFFTLSVGGWVMVERPNITLNTYCLGNVEPASVPQTVRGRPARQEGRVGGATGPEEQARQPDEHGVLETRRQVRARRVQCQTVELQAATRCARTEPRWPHG